MITETEFVILDHHKRIVADNNIRVSNLQNSLNNKDQKLLEMQKYILEVERMVFAVCQENQRLKNELSAYNQDIEYLEDTIKALRHKLTATSDKSVVYV